MFFYVMKIVRELGQKIDPMCMYLDWCLFIPLLKEFEDSKRVIRIRKSYVVVCLFAIDISLDLRRGQGGSMG